MKDLIKKILKESLLDVPDWFREWESLPRDERVEVIEQRKEQYIKLIPKIISLFEKIYGDDLDHISVVDKKVYYSSETYSTTIPNMLFYFNKKQTEVKKQIREYLKSFFNIEYEFYGIPLDFEVFVKEWRKI
jgi:predicted GTPase